MLGVLALNNDEEVDDGVFDGKAPVDPSDIEARGDGADSNDGSMVSTAVESIRGLFFGPPTLLTEGVRLRGGALRSTSMFSNFTRGVPATLPARNSATSSFNAAFSFRSRSFSSLSRLPRVWS